MYQEQSLIIFTLMNENSFDKLCWQPENGLTAENGLCHILGCQDDLCRAKALNIIVDAVK